jgi:iron-sulfur cluster assembly protein
VRAESRRELIRTKGLTNKRGNGSTVGETAVTNRRFSPPDEGGTIGLVEIIERPERAQHGLISLTEAAAAKIKELQAEETPGEAAVLRVAVQGGGCSGFEYALGFDRGAEEGDHELQFHGVSVVVDPFSAPYLRGAEIDFVNGLQESGFKVNNPNVVAACGCGHSFQVAEGEAPEAAGGSGCGSGCSH